MIHLVVRLFSCFFVVWKTRIQKRTSGFVLRQTIIPVDLSSEPAGYVLTCTRTCTRQTMSNTKQSRRPQHTSRRYERGNTDDEDSDHDYGDGDDGYGGDSSYF